MTIKSPNSIRIIGIDPGSRLTGFGVIDVIGREFKYIASGVISTLKEDDFSIKLKLIYEGVSEVCRITSPDESAIEKTFFSKNALSALKLGQARGAAIAALAMSHLPVLEISPNEVKQCLVGYGLASKDQVLEMVQTVLRLEELKSRDESDALAIAISLANQLRFRDKRRASQNEIRSTI